MFIFQNFDEVFDFDQDCSYNEYAVQEIESNRKKLEGLFVDTLLKNFEIRRPVKYYPPKSNNDLRNLHKVIIDSAGEDHHKLSALYYILLDFDAPTGRRDYSTTFEQKSFLPQSYQIYVKGLWHLDRLDFESALQYLTHPSLIPSFVDEILEALVLHSSEDLAIPLAYYHTVQPALTSSRATESLFSAIARTSVTEAFYFSRGQSQYMQRHLFELLIAAVLKNSPQETIADRSVELVNLPFSPEEETWFEDYLLRGEGRAIRKGRDTIMMRRIGTGKFSETLLLKGIGGKSIGGLDWDRLFEHSDQNANSNKNGFNNRLDKAIIKQDLTADRPQWILSAYGPGRHAPEQLFGGPTREQSFEEMRLRHYVAAASGNVQPAIQDAERLWEEADLQIRNALNDVDGAINYIIAADNEHPNRIDFCRQQATSTDPTPWAQRNVAPSGNNAFGAPSQITTSAFGQPPTQNGSTFAHPPTQDGSAFGQPPTQNGSAFGQPSSQNSNAFGVPSQGFVAAQQGGTPGGFGQPSNLGPKPSAFGTAFGQPSQLEQRAGAFGTPSTMGQNTNPFGAPSDSGTNAGQPGFSNFGGTSNPFGQPNPEPLGGAFSSNPLPPGIQQPQVNPTAQNNNFLAQGNSFGQPPPTNPFGSNNGNTQPFGAPTPAPNNPFGALSSQPINAVHNQFTNTGPQAQQSGHQQNFENLNAIAGAPTALGGSNWNTFSPNFRPPPPNAKTLEHPPAESYIRLGPDDILQAFNGLPVVYKDGEPGTNINGKWSKIWCTKGYPGPNKTTEMEDATFDESTTTAYFLARQTGAFPGNVMPLIPPKREWCLWNF
ncbi:hypothetical protein SBOR_2958 [Sclerotinia borealis F-4128]|uniref:ELYS-like domain-containing protein n=1 Tax=Sclerotinia borealis (strain F-4128) TaxID=1432307 RepID=W9CKW2_SCLBF|nr:hypothetical protein SBOR_2958 [Sclerotinia borealis F-4128]